MPAPKTAIKDKQAAAGSAPKDAKKKGEKTAPVAEAPKAAAAPATDSPKPKSGADAPVAVAVAAGGKPDQVAYNKEQDELKKEIDELNKKLVSTLACI